jgi:hypothetical protein
LPDVVFVALKPVMLFAFVNVNPPLLEVVNVVALMIPVSVIAPPDVKPAVDVVLTPVILKAPAFAKLIAPASAAVPAVFIAFSDILLTLLFALFNVIAAPPVNCVVTERLLPAIAAAVVVPFCVIAPPPTNVMLPVVPMPATSKPLPLLKLMVPAAFAVFAALRESKLMLETALPAFVKVIAAPLLFSVRTFNALAVIPALCVTAPVEVKFKFPVPVFTAAFTAIAPLLLI